MYVVLWMCCLKKLPSRYGTFAHYTLELTGFLMIGLDWHWNDYMSEFYILKMAIRAKTIEKGHKIA